MWSTSLGTDSKQRNCFLRDRRRFEPRQRTILAFAFLANVSVIIAVIKTPSLQRPCNILMCSLATADCLTGLVAQPLFVAWRLMISIPRIYQSCDHQVELFKAFGVRLMVLQDGRSPISLSSALIAITRSPSLWNTAQR